VLSAYAVIEVVDRSQTAHGGSWWRRNEITIVMTLISFIFPMLFEILGIIEYYHPRMQLRLQLARIMSLNLLNLGSLIWALFQKVANMTKQMEIIKNIQNDTKMMLKGEMPITTTLPTTPTSVLATPLPTFATTLENSSTTEDFEDALSTLRSFTEGAIEKVAEILSTVRTTTKDPAVSYPDYNDPDYFDVSTSTTTFDSNFTETDYSEDFTTDASNFSVFDFLMRNLMNATVSSFVNHNETTTSFMEQYYYEEDYYKDQSAVSDSLPEARGQSLMMSKGVSMHQWDDPNVDDHMKYLNDTLITELRTLCWETMFGQGK
jgi:hypothetical protein